MYTAIRFPGKYQADRSELLAKVLESMVNEGRSSDEVGDCETTGHYARIDGKRYSYLLETDNQGFVTYQIVRKYEIESVWEHVVKTVEELKGGINHE